MERRKLLMAVVANGALAAVPSAFAAPRLEGQVTRLQPGTVRLTWNARAEPVTVFASSDPDAQPLLMRQVKSAVRGGETDLPFAIAPRPYFLLRTTGGSQVRVAERLLPLQGGRNFRDLGGYLTSDGRQVCWGRIYRSGVMSGLTAADMAYLSDLDIQVICDLRARQELLAQPNPLLKKGAPRIEATEYDLASTSMSKAFTATTREQAITGFADTYLDFAERLTPQFTDMFAHLARREAPLVMNCSAGKDRTGVAAALILSVLGVPRETIIADYALTEAYSPPSARLKQLANGTAGVTLERSRAITSLAPDVQRVLLGSDPEVMRHALLLLDRKYGGPVVLAKTRYGLTDAKIAYMRSVYLT